MNRASFILLVLFVCVTPTMAQDGVWLTDTLSVSSAQPFQLKPFVRAGTETVSLDGTRLDTAAYRLNARAGYLWLNQPVDSTAVLVVRYRTLPFTFKPAYYNRVFTPVDADTIKLTGIVMEAVETRPADFDLFSDTKLERHGSITRGIIAGNNRDVSLESGLRIQLSGEVTEGVTCRLCSLMKARPSNPMAPRSA